MSLPVHDYRVFKAKFVPHRTDDLRSDASLYVGRTMEFRFAWVMDDSDPYPGEAAYVPIDDCMGWVPTRDLEVDND